MADKKEYIERGALLKTPPFTKFGGDSTWYTEGYLDCAEEARKAVNDAPAADVVSKGVYDKVKWERDMAMQQLDEHGIPFGGTADNVVEVVYGEWTLIGYGNGRPLRWKCSACGYETLDAVNGDTNFCPNCGAKMDGGRKEQT